MRLLCSFLILLICLTAIQARAKTIDFAELEKTIEAELKANKTPGASVTIVGGDKIVYAKGEIEHVSFGLYSARKISGTPSSKN